MSARPLHCLCVLLLPLLLIGCGEDGLYRFAVVTDGVHELRGGQTVDGLLLVLDGRVQVQEDAIVAGSIYQLEGELDLDGRVTGNVVQLGGSLTIAEHAHIEGEVRQTGGNLELTPGAEVEGQLLRGSDVDLDLRPDQAERSLVGQLGWTLVQAVLLGVLAATATRLVPRPLHRVADAVTEHPLTSLALGILVWIVGPSLLVVMAFTVLLIPVSVLGLILGGAVAAYGLIAWGTVMARRLLQRWPAWSPSRAAFLGTALFVVLMEASTLVPLVGGLIPLVLLVTAVGAVFLTRFGRQRFVPATDRVESA